MQNVTETLYVGGEHAADRLMKSQKLQAGSPYLQGSEPPTEQQVSAVLHALADHSLQERWNSDEVVEVLGGDRAHLGDNWGRVTAQGRFLQRMGDMLDHGFRVQ